MKALCKNLKDKQKKSLYKNNPVRLKVKKVLQNNYKWSWANHKKM